MILKYKTYSLLFNSPLIMYLVVGLVNTIVGYGIFALMVYVGLHYSLALLIATVLGILFNFKSTGYFVFKSNNNNLILRFVAVYAIIYVVNVMGLKLLSLLAINIYFSGAILLLPIASLAFLLNKRFVFRP